jgi:hypothetical protein
LFAICATVHFAAAVSAFAWSYSVTSLAFDGRPTGAIGRHLAGPLATALWFPILPIMETAAANGFRPSPVIQWLLLAGNSAVWGFAATLVISRLARPRAGRQRLAAGFSQVRQPEDN